MKTKIGLILVVLGMLFHSLNADITTGLVAYYPFNGNANDESGNNNSSSITGAVLTADRNGAPNKAYSFDGVNDTLLFGMSSRPYDSFSYGAWIKVNKTITIYGEATGGPALYDGQNHAFDPSQSGTDAGAGLSVGTNGIQVFEHGNSYLTVLASYSGSVGTGWNHIYVVYNAKQPTIYLNGVAVRTGLKSIRPKVLASKSVGPDFSSYCAFKGSIDEIKIYKQSLSASEILALYNQEKPQASGLVAYYPFNGNANDESGNGNNGTVNGATLTTDRFGKADSAYNLNGVSSIEAPHSQSLNLTKDMTFNFWVNPTVWNYNKFMVLLGYSTPSGYDQYVVGISSDNRLYFHYSNPYADGGSLHNDITDPSGASWETGRWYFVSVVVSTTENKIAFYRDGTLLSSFHYDLAKATILEYSGAVLYMGKNSAENDCINAKLDDIRIYNRALSSEEIAGLYGNDMVNLTMAVSPAGTGTTSPATGTAAVAKSKTITVTATPAQGYAFVNWTAYPQGHVTFENPQSAYTGVKLCAAATITANFAIKTYTVTFDLAGKGTSSDSLVQTVNHGGAATAPAVTANDGWNFTRWDKDFSSVTSSLVVVAQYVPITYTVNFKASTGGTLCGTAAQTVNYGAPSTPVTAIPDPNYYFTGWTGDYSGTANPLTITKVTGNMNITANFARSTAQFTMVVSPQDSGTTTPSGTTTVDLGTPVSINATPATGYRFINWTATAGATVADANSTNTTATLSADCTITAAFAIDTQESTEFKKVSVNICESKKKSDSISILEGGLPNSISEDDINTANFKFILRVDAFEEVLSNENGQLIYRADKKLYTFKPDKSTGRKGAFSISLADGKRYWNFRESGLDLSEKVDNFDGLEIYLTVNGKTFGSILDTDETSLHKFTKNADNYKELSVAGQEFDAFSVNKAEGKVFDYRLSADSFKINDGQMKLPEGYEFSATDPVSLIIDDAEFIAADPSAWKISKNAAVYKCASEKGVMTILFNLKNNTWRAKVEKTDLSSYIYDKDGIEIHLVVGGCEGAAIINPDTSTFLKYDNGAGR